ncbi:hypothetical protein TPHA_0B03590 [Tetrapisispora phaffii CBS 4417]|uniref:Uncharacterized protein n=1 Tax=Tetrapisispora phaffii (strain ATCC 24235 / CBS 4417 / NBRC 1672 / NRRL Y-8282 / UCD 70-5) TaxID=1071381 RepID=G8BPU8_TETPH|nr:hypothetical protein TPHA_0B03590 [Tetrapisispora phaffii CBS 4417]CCE62029.1 hypothetical protein TPHA_0B03590 [Tetrapisispora phaffii CBS 4417]
MFIDYSSLTRYKEINDIFLSQCTILMKFYDEKTIQSKLEFIIREFESLDLNVPDAVFFMDESQLEQFLYLTLCNNQMKQAYDVIIRCPTLYLVEPDFLSPIKYKEYYIFQIELCKQVKDLRKEYRYLRIKIFENVKNLIISLVPNMSSDLDNFENLNTLQKILFKFHSEISSFPYEVPDVKFDIPNIRNENTLELINKYGNQIKRFNFYNFMFMTVPSDLGNYNFSNNDIKLLKTKHKINITFQYKNKEEVKLFPYTFDNDDQYKDEKCENVSICKPSSLFSTATEYSKSVNLKPNYNSLLSSDANISGGSALFGNIFESSDDPIIFTDDDLVVKEISLQKNNEINILNLKTSLPSSTLKPTYNLVSSNNTSYNRSESLPYKRNYHCTSEKENEIIITPRNQTLNDVTLNSHNTNILRDKKNLQEQMVNCKIKSLDEISIKEFIKYKLTRLKIGIVAKSEYVYDNN